MSTASLPGKSAVSNSQLEEERFWALVLANDDVEVMPLDACTAASLGHIEQLTRYTAGDLDSANRCGWTPLMYAACLGHTSTVQYLGRRRVSSSFYAGKTENSSEGRQQTALMLAAANGHDEAVSALLALPDCKANVGDNRGWTALFYAIAYGHPSTVELLLKNGSDPNSTEKTRLASPLIMAAEAGHDDIVRILLRSGADLNQKTRDGATAMDVASMRGHVQVVNLLHRAQSKMNRPTQTFAIPTGQQLDRSSNQQPTNTGKPMASNPLDSDLAKLLSKLGLDHYSKDFAAGQITFTSLMRSSEEDLRQLPFLTVGARKQLMLEISAKQINSSTNAADAEVAKIFIPAEGTARVDTRTTFNHFLGHVSVLVGNCSLLPEAQKGQLLDIVNGTIKELQRSQEKDPDIFNKMTMINSYFDAFLAQS